MRGNSKIAHKWDMLENIAASYTDALKLDPQLRQLLTNNLPWNDIFILLRNSDPFHIKYIEKGSKRANPILLVFDDVNQDQVIRMEIEPGGSPLFVSMYSAFRVKQDYTREMHFVKSVTDRILLTLWELCEIVSK